MLHVFLCFVSSLGYVEGNTVQLKGRVACEINTCDELIATEMVFENVLESLDPPEIAGWSKSFLRSLNLPGLSQVRTALQRQASLFQPDG